MCVSKNIFISNWQHRALQLIFFHFFPSLLSDVDIIYSAVKCIEFQSTSTHYTKHTRTHIEWIKSNAFSVSILHFHIDCIYCNGLCELKSFFDDDGNGLWLEVCCARNENRNSNMKIYQQRFGNWVDAHRRHMLIKISTKHSFSNWRRFSLFLLKFLHFDRNFPFKEQEFSVKMKCLPS